MLSFIYRMYREYEREHQYPPNVLYINSEHFERLRREFANPNDLNGIRRLLGMEIVVKRDAVHPQMGWLQAAERKAV